MRLRIFVELREHVFRHCHIHANGPRLLGLDKNQDGDAIPIVGIGHHGIERGWLWDCLAILRQACEMKCQRVLSHATCAIERGASGGQTRKIRKGNAEIPIAVLANETDIAAHAARLSFNTIEQNKNIVQRSMGESMGRQLQRCGWLIFQEHEQERPYAYPRPAAAPARKLSKNFSTSADSVSVVAARPPEAESTEAAAVEVSPMASRSDEMLATSVWLPCAADWALAEISPVAASCWPTAPAIVDVMPLMPRTALPISRTASTALLVEAWITATFWPISSVAFAVCPASALTSCATTAKPRPASPARAASIVALSASRLVCSAMAVMSLTTSPMRLADRDNCPMQASVFSACRTASPAMRADSCTCRLISLTEEDS